MHWCVLGRQKENISRGSTFGDFVTIRTEGSMQDTTVARLLSTVQEYRLPSTPSFKCNVYRSVKVSLWTVGWTSAVWTSSLWTSNVLTSYEWTSGIVCQCDTVKYLYCKGKSLAKMDTYKSIKRVAAHTISLLLVVCACASQSADSLSPSSTCSEDS